MSATASPAQVKVLKVALVVEEQIAQERVIDRATPVTIGTSDQATFTSAAAGVDSFEVFAWRDGRYVLRFLSSMKGKVTAGGEEYVLKKAAKAGNLQKDGDAFLIELGDDDKGRFEVGGATVLFRFVEPPAAPAPIPVDNFDFRPRLLDRDDPAFGGFLMLFSALGIVFSIWVTNAERPKPDMSMLQRDLERIAKIPKATPKKVEEITEADTKEEKPEEKAEEKKPEEKKEPEKPLEKPKVRTAAEQAQAVAQARENLRDRSALFKAALALGPIGTRGAGFGTTQLVDAAQLQALGAQMKDTVNSEAAAGASGIRGGGQGVVGGTDKGIGSLEATKGDAAKALVEAPKVQVKGTTSFGEPATGGDSNPVDVRKVVSTNKAKLTYCYESRLKANPKLAGKVTVEWEIKGGKPTGVSVSSNTTNDSELGSCIKSSISRWSFAGIEDGDVTQSFVFAPQE